MTKDEMVGWNHRLSGHEFEQTPGDSEGQGSPACSLVCGVTESDTTEQLNNNKVSSKFQKELWPPKRLRIIAKAEGATEDEMIEWHHQLSGHEFEQTPGNSKGLGSLACCSP